MTEYFLPILWLMGSILLLWERLSKLRNERKSTDGDVAGKLSEAWERLNKPLQTQIDNLQADAKEDRSALREYMHGTRVLIMQLEDNRIIPRWRPPTEYAEIERENPTQPV